MQNFVDSIVGVAKASGPIDVLDTFLVAFLVYQGIKLVRDTRAIQLVKGLLLVATVYVIAQIIHLRTLMFLIQNHFQIGAYALLIVFQPELRRALEKVGRTRFSDLQFFGVSSEAAGSNLQWALAIRAVSEAAGRLSNQKVGALIVMEQQGRLGEIAGTGTMIDSSPSSELIENIFFPNSPLHDGALIIRQGRLLAAGCLLPLSENSQIARELGTRHRAGLGISESSDAVVVIVSEETGVITVAQNGKLSRGYTADQLSKRLEENFIKATKTRSPRRASAEQVKR
jgi:diadenylate cyclase